MMTNFIALIVLLGIVSTSCAYGASMFPREPQVPVSKFGYNALMCPLNWYGLNKTANYACDNGTTQSPVIIDGLIPVVSGSSITAFAPIDYPNGAIFENLGANVKVVVNGTPVDGISGITYSLAKFRFHTPSEHSIDSEFYPMEMHWVFESTGTTSHHHSNARNNQHTYQLPAKQYAVIAFLDELCESTGCTDPALQSVFKSISAITEPGNATLTGPLYFGKLTGKFLANYIWR